MLALIRRRYPAVSLSIRLYPPELSPYLPTMTCPRPSSTALLGCFVYIGSLLRYQQPITPRPLFPRLTRTRTWGFSTPDPDPDPGIPHCTMRAPDWHADRVAHAQCCAMLIQGGGWTIASSEKSTSPRPGKRDPPGAAPPVPQLCLGSDGSCLRVCGRPNSFWSNPSTGVLRITHTCAVLICIVAHAHSRNTAACLLSLSMSPESPLPRCQRGKEMRVK